MKHTFAIYVSAVAALGGLLFGYDTAVIAGTVEFLQKRFALSDLALGDKRRRIQSVSPMTWLTNLRSMRDISRAD